MPRKGTATDRRAGQMKRKKKEAPFYGTKPKKPKGTSTATERRATMKRARKK
jgi:hypothetical protein